MNISSLKATAARLALVTATGGFLVGMAFVNSGAAHAIGGLCNGVPASHTFLDASGQPGPAVLDGTRGDDVIIGANSDNTIDGHGGNDIICGGPGGNDSITVEALRPGESDVVSMPGGGSVTGVGPGDFTFYGGTQTSTLEVTNPLKARLYGGPNDSIMIHDGRPADVKMYGDPHHFNVCIVAGGDEANNCVP